MANNIEINYDLGQDLLLNDDIRSLKKLALLYIIPNFFTPELLRRYLFHVYPEITEPECGNMNYINEVSEVMEDEIVRELEKFVIVPIDCDVSEIIHFVANQIFLFLAKSKYPLLIVFVIVEYFEFTWQGTINLKRTYEKTLLNETLSGKEKYAIACKSFMELDTIVRYYGLLTNEEIDHYVNEEPIKEENIPEHFFLCLIRCHTKTIETTFIQDEEGEFVTITFSRLCSRSTIYYLFLWAMLSFNDLAVQYIWENYISDMSEEYIRIPFMLSCVIGNFRMANFVIYLLSKISDSEIEILFQVSSKIIFEYLILQLRWQSSFSKVINVLHRRFQIGTYATILKFMISVICSDREKFSNNILIEFLTNMPSEVKHRLLVEYDSLYYEMLQSLYNNNDLATCSVLLEINGPLNIDNLFSTNLKNILFNEPILSGKFHIIVNILGFYFKSSHQINGILIKFCRDKAPYVCHKVFLFKNLENLMFINFCLPFVPLRDIMRLKSDILFIEDGKFIKTLIFKDQRADADDTLQLADEVIEWCLHSQVLRTNFKNCIKMVKKTDDASEDEDVPDNINVFEEVREHLLNYNFNILYRFLKWKSCSHDEINEMKNSLFNDNKFYKFIFHKRNMLNSFSYVQLLEQIIKAKETFFIRVIVI